MNINLYPKVVAIAAHDWLVFHRQANSAVNDARPNDLNAIPAAPYGVAVIPVVGVLLPSVPDWMRTFGLRVTGYDEIVAQVKTATDNPAITEIVLAVDSPGGTVQGVVAASAAVRDAATKKTVTVWVEGMCASGAYWLCAPASRIVASTTAEVGSIGVYQVWYDESVRLEKAGITTHVIRSGAHKGMGLDAITPEQLETEQQTVDDLAALFTQAVAAGRKLSDGEAQILATGQSWTAERARLAGLVDIVTETYEVGQLVDDLKEQNMSKAEKDLERIKAKAKDEDYEDKSEDKDEDEKDESKAEDMKENEDEKAEGAEGDGEEEDEDEDKNALASERARCAAIVTAFGKLDPAFCAEMIGAGASEVEAKAAWFDRAAPTASVNGKPRGVPPIPSAEAPSAAAKPKIYERICAIQVQDGVDVVTATKRVQADDPETFARYQRGESV